MTVGNLRINITYIRVTAIYSKVHIICTGMYASSAVCTMIVHSYVLHNWLYVHKIGTLEYQKVLASWPVNGKNKNLFFGQVIPPPLRIKNLNGLSKTVKRWRCNHLCFLIF